MASVTAAQTCMDSSNNCREKEESCVTIHIAFCTKILVFPSRQSQARAPAQGQFLIPQLSDYRGCQVLYLHSNYHCLHNSNRRTTGLGIQTLIM